MTLTRLIFAIIFTGFLSVTASGITFFLNWSKDLPDYRQLDQFRLRATSYVYARDGRLVATLAPNIGGERINRTVVSMSEIAPVAVAALVGSEDRKFFEHYGFDPLRLARSVLETLRGNQQGGSTITQQVVRLTILKPDKTAERKFKELMLAIQIERFFTKNEILTMYLNASFWGGNLHGIKAASQAYFGKDPINLTLAESLYLAALLPGPNSFFGDFDRARAGMRSRLDRLVEDGWVNKEQADIAWKEKIVPRGWQITYDNLGNVTSSKLLNRRINLIAEIKTEFAPYFMGEVRRVLKRDFNEETFQQGGLRIYTTLDPKIQQSIEETAATARTPVDKAQVAIAAVDPQNGELIAVAGGRGGDEFNRATMSRRNPGSSFKPFLYATAIEKGLNQWDEFDDKPITVDLGGGYTWEPRNFSRTSLNKPVMLRYSLDHSLNLPTVHLGLDIGLDNFRDKLRLLGIEAKEQLNPAAMLGAIEGGVSPVQMAAAYASFVNGGVWTEPHLIRRIEDAQGRVLYQAEPMQRRVWSPQTAYIASDMLYGVVHDPAYMSGQFALNARIPGRFVIGKTGTTNDVRDMWFVGATPEISVATWAGQDDNKPMPSWAFSGDYMPKIWHDFVVKALEERQPREMAVPSSIDYRYVNGIKMAYLSGPVTESQEEAGSDPFDAAAGPATPTPLPEEETPNEPINPQSLPSTNEIVLPLDICSNPPKVADATTAPDCIEERAVKPENLRR